MKTAFHTREEELALIAVAQAGFRAEARQDAGSPAPFDGVAVLSGKVALRELVGTNTKFMIKRCNYFAFRFDYRTRARELLSEATLGLIDAIRRFDLSRGTRLLTLGRWYIDNAIRKTLPRQRPTKQQRAEQESQPITPEVEEQYLVAPEPSEYAEEISLLDEAYAYIGPRLTLVIHMREIEGLDYPEIAKAVGVGPERARQLRGMAVQKLREFYAQRAPSSGGIQPSPAQ